MSQDHLLCSPDMGLMLHRERERERERSEIERAKLPRKCQQKSWRARVGWPSIRLLPRKRRGQLDLPAVFDFHQLEFYRGFLNFHVGGSSVYKIIG